MNIQDRRGEHCRNRDYFHEAPAITDDACIGLFCKLKGTYVGGDGNGSIGDQTNAAQPTVGTCAGDADRIVGRCRCDACARRAVCTGFAGNRAGIIVVVDEIDSGIHLVDEIFMGEVATVVDDHDGHRRIAERSPPDDRHSEPLKEPLATETRIIGRQRLVAAVQKMEVRHRRFDLRMARAQRFEAHGNRQTVRAVECFDAQDCQRRHQHLLDAQARFREHPLVTRGDSHQRKAIDSGFDGATVFVEQVHGLYSGCEASARRFERRDEHGPAPVAKPTAHRR